MNKRNYAFLAAVTILAHLITLQSAAIAAVPVQIRINLSKATDIQVAEQVNLLKKLHELFTSNQVKAGFWFTGAAYRDIMAHAPELIPQLLKNNFVIAHHGANYGSTGARFRSSTPEQKAESPVKKVASMDWEDAVAWVMNFEQKQDGGGLSRMQNDLHGNIQVTGRFFRAPILQGTKQLGCKAMLGLKKELKAPSNAAWYMGMFNLPDGETIPPERIISTASNPVELYKQLDGLVAQWPKQSIETISIPIHDNEFWHGSPEEQTRLWSAYQSLIAWISKNPDLVTVTYDDLIKKVIDDHHPIVTRSLLSKATEQLLEHGSLPLYISVENTPLSLTDLFSSLAISLKSYFDNGEFPQSIQAERLLGPTEITKKQQKTVSSVSSKDFLAAITRWVKLKSDRVPAVLQINKSVSVNSAEILAAMAGLYRKLDQSIVLPEHINIKQLSVFPEQTEDCPDELSRLQFWTYKPQRPVVTSESRKAADSENQPKADHRTDTPIYITIYSHNEEGLPWRQLLNDPNLYKQYRANLIEKILLIREYNAALSWQTDHVVLQAMLQYEKGDILKNTNNKNILRWMSEDMSIEIAPHGHITSHNYADISYLIKKLGVTPAPVIGGFALYSCDEKNPSQDLPIAERNWLKELEIQTDGSIIGRKYPEFTWRPEILVQPAMIGHAFEEFSSGVWRPDTTKGIFTRHNPNGKFIHVGQGYPHYVEHIGPQAASGTVIQSSSSGYIKELAEKIQTTPEMQGRMYTASIHTRDYPYVKRAQIDTYYSLKYTLEQLAPLVHSNKVMYMNYSDIADRWRKQYKSEPCRYSIEDNSLFQPLKYAAQNYCQNKNIEYNVPTIKKCGDGICDEHEQRTGMCKEDCFTSTHPK